jgi:tetratricopeptide (TPR) repeat protein
MHVKALYNAGLTSYYLLQYSNAIQFIQKALIIQPKVPEYWYALGLVHASRNEKHIAAGYWNQCLQLDKDNPKYYYAIGSLYDETAKDVKVDYFTKAANLGDEKAKAWLDAQKIGKEEQKENTKSKKKKR